MSAAAGLPEFSKVVCYGIVEGKVLVFRHRDVPEAGLQVPAGTVEPNEEPRAAAIREASEETGKVFEVVEKIGELDLAFDEPPRRELHHRQFFAMRALEPLPERWLQFAEGHCWFEFEWMPVAQAVSALSYEQGALLDLASAQVGA